MENFDEFNLDNSLRQAIGELGWKKPTDIQEGVFKKVMQGCNVVISARTGSGKTAACVIPILQRLIQQQHATDPQQQQIRVIYLTPTKEMCEQASRNIRELAKYAPRRISFENISAIDRQYENCANQNVRMILSSRPDIVISTPRDLLEQLDPSVSAGSDAIASSSPTSSSISIDYVEVLVIDEADMMQGFGYDTIITQLAGILNKRSSNQTQEEAPPTKKRKKKSAETPSQVVASSSASQPSLQKIFMSATILDNIAGLLELFPRSKWVKIEALQHELLPAAHTQLVHYRRDVSSELDKAVLLIAIFKMNLIKGKTLIFANSVNTCYRLRILLENFNLPAAVLNSEMPLLSRSEVISQFNKGSFNILIASDEKPSSHPVAAGNNKRCDLEFGVSRGLDFHNLGVVINFELPPSINTYIHRVGRTARANNQGTAISFVITQDAAQLEMAAKIDAALSVGGGGDKEEKNASLFQEFRCPAGMLDGWVYRVRDVFSHITRRLINVTRLHDIRQEMANSTALRRTFFRESEIDRLAIRHDRLFSAVGGGGRGGGATTSTAEISTSKRRKGGVAAARASARQSVAALWKNPDSATHLKNSTPPDYLVPPNLSHLVCGGGGAAGGGGGGKLGSIKFRRKQRERAQFLTRMQHSQDEFKAEQSKARDEKLRQIAGKQNKLQQRARNSKSANPIFSFKMNK